MSTRQNQEIKQNTSITTSRLVKRVAGGGIPFLCAGLFILFTIALLLSYPMPQIASTEPVIPKPSELTYSVSISAPEIQIMGGNLHWHKKLPNDTYTLEDMTIEIYNFGNFDILVAQLEITVDDDTKLFDIDRVIQRGERESTVLQPMMEGYDGGTHNVYMALLDENGGVLYENKGEVIGPLEPIPGTGSWKPVPN